MNINTSASPSADELQAVQQLGAKVWQLGNQHAVGERDSTTQLATVALGGDYARVRTDSRIDASSPGPSSSTMIVTTPSRADESIAMRDRDHFGWNSGPGILMIDYDPPKNGPALAKEGLLEILYTALPELRCAAHFWWTSAGSAGPHGSSHAASGRIPSAAAAQSIRRM